MQVAPTLFTQKGKPMGFYLPPGPRKAEISELIQDHGGKVNLTWNADLITLVEPAYAGKSSQGAPLYSFEYVLASIRKCQLLPLESYKVQAAPSPAPPRSVAPSPGSGTKKGRSGYTKEEDEAIKQYVKSHTQFSPTGNVLWRNMEQSGVVPGHTWQSVKDRFLHRLLPVEEALLGSTSSTTTTSSTRRSTSASRRVSFARDSDTPVRKRLFEKGTDQPDTPSEKDGVDKAQRKTPTKKQVDEEEEEEDEVEEEEEERGSEEEADGEKETRHEEEDENGEEAEQKVYKSPGRGVSPTKGGSVPNTPTAAGKRKATTPAKATSPALTPRKIGKRRKIEEEEEEEEDEEGDMPLSGTLSRASPRSVQLDHVIARLREEAECSASVAFHALLVASGDPSLALLYLQGREMWYQPWTPAEDQGLQGHNARALTSLLVARAKTDVEARRVFLGVPSNDV